MNDERIRQINKPWEREGFEDYTPEELDAIVATHPVPETWGSGLEDSPRTEYGAVLGLEPDSISLVNLYGRVMADMFTRGGVNLTWYQGGAVTTSPHITLVQFSTPDSTDVPNVSTWGQDVISHRSGSATILTPAKIVYSPPNGNLFLLFNPTEWLAQSMAEVGYHTLVEPKLNNQNVRPIRQMYDNARANPEWWPRIRVTGGRLGMGPRQKVTIGNCPKNMESAIAPILDGVNNLLAVQEIPIAVSPKVKLYTILYDGRLDQQVN